MSSNPFHNLAPVIPFESLIVDKAKGDYLYDRNGRRVLDVNSGQFCAVFGHSDSGVAEVVSHAALTHQHSCTSVISESVIRAADALNRISGNLDARSILLSTGSEAVETCLRYAKHISGKPGIVCFDNGYHGLTMGSQSVTYSGIYTQPHIPLIFPIEPPSQGDAVALADSLTRLESYLQTDGDKIGLMLFEPVVSVGGLVYPDAEFFKQAAVLAKKHNVLLAFDESQTGFGRLGTWFAYQSLGVLPDFVICSKAIGLGYPVAAVLFSGALVDSNEITLAHYSSHQNDSFGAEIILYGIKRIEEMDYLHSASEIGRRLLESLQRIEAKCNIFTNARGAGLMLGLDFLIDGVDDYRPIYRRFHELMLERNVLIQGCDGGRVLRFLPSYCITPEEIEEMEAAMVDAGVFLEVELSNE